MSWAAHRLNGVCCPISPAYTTEQVAHQLEFVKCKALFTSAPLIEVALEAAATAGIPRNHVYILEIPEAATKGQKAPKDLKTVDQLIEQGRDKSPLPGLNWSPGQGARQTAFLCSSSGTSGLPVSVNSDGHLMVVLLKRTNRLGLTEKRNHHAPQRHCQHCAIRDFWPCIPDQ